MMVAKEKKSRRIDKTSPEYQEMSKREFFKRLPSGCWEMSGAPNTERQQYKNFHDELAHRVMWRMIFGEIPKGLLVLHHCDNPPCVRPDHLFLGTYADNMQDMHNKGRHPGKPRITHCPNGHPYTDGNLIKRQDRKNHRECLTCHRNRASEYYKKRKGVSL